MKHTFPVWLGAALVSAPLAAAQAPPGFDSPDKIFTIRTLPALMKYDLSELQVSPGDRVKVILKNEDQLPHNLVVLSEPNCSMQVAMKAWELAERGMERNWIPDDPRVLASTPMVDPGAEGAVFFQAPDRDAQMDFVCTFPGHAMLMKGSIRVSATPPPGPLKNLTYMLFHGEWNRLPDFDQLPAEARVRTEEINDGLIDLEVAERGDHFALVFNGTLQVPQDGTYRFFLSSDDGSRLVIDGERLIEMNQIQGTTEKVARQALKKGDHHLRVEYFEAAGGEHLSLAWDGPGVKMQPLSREVRRRAPQVDPVVLAPRDGRPVIYRGFMSGTGGSRRIINVGYPGQLNVAFDQDQLRLARLWKGEFLDVGRHWEGRGAGEVPPSGYAHLEFPPGPQALARPGSEDTWPQSDEFGRWSGGKFLGYELDAAGRPEFRYTCGELHISDTFQPEGEITRGTESMRRRLQLSGGVGQPVHLRLCRGDGISIEGGRARLGHLQMEVSGPGELRRSGDDLLLVLPAASLPATVEVRYTWL